MNLFLSRDIVELLGMIVLVMEIMGVIESGVSFGMNVL